MSARAPEGCAIANTVPQELGQADISVILKAGLKERLTVVRKAFDKQIKEKEGAANKQVRGHSYELEASS